ncbi:MAG: hypothetical protein P4M07_28145 [Xanthobacteraceae bacterium]|nr:hypothetical protein [Xanthobacteraceae bacterium]
MWARLKKLCFNSATMAWGYVLAAGGVILQTVDGLADTLGDPGFRQQVSDALGADTRVLGRIFLGISIVTMIARARSIRKAS